MSREVDDWKATIAAARELRQKLHANPELGWGERKTAAIIRSKLDELNISWRVCADTGTLATIRPEAEGRHIALRCDIDALPLTEETRLPYASKTAGCMHACGHDGHTATLLAAASWLKRHASSLPGSVTLLFQPAEEGGHGAEAMIKDGALEGVDVIYGWHNWPAIPFGKMACPAGLLMCGNGTFEIEVIGRGGHASQPDLCADPLLAASAIHVNLQQIVSRRIAPQRPVVLSVTSIDAMSAPTVTSERVTLSGSIRVPDDVIREELNAAIDTVAEHTAHAYGARCEVRHFPRYGATYNHPEEASRIRRLWTQHRGAGALDSKLLLPVMASEDFSYYLMEIPGAFALVGADDGPDHRHSCHSPHYDFNDRLIEEVLRLFAELVGAPVPASENEKQTEKKGDAK